ncbi:Threonine synthase, partial [mine drainage metagenome]
ANGCFVKGTYDDVNRLCSEIGAEYPWAFVNINIRPYYAEGSKSLAFETLNSWGGGFRTKLLFRLRRGPF